MDRFSVRGGAARWTVWDSRQDFALASFDTMADAETCRAACELVHRETSIGAAPRNGTRQVHNVAGAALRGGPSSGPKSNRIARRLSR